MKIKTSLIILILLAASLPMAGQKRTAKDLPPKYRQWLQEEVVYIISPKERDVFLQLQTDRDRDLFIEAFWKARNPDPSSPTNKAKDEHYRRIQYANLWFGRGLAAGGWRSDRGRIYITLGEPKQIENHENDSNLYPMIIWFYEGMGEYGLPNAFNIVFFKKDGAGDLVLYSPVRDGPMKLMPNYNGDMTSYNHAFQEMLDISPSIAAVSMTLIPNEYLMGMSPSLSSEVLLAQQIPKAGYEKVKDTYAEKLLKYKDIVEVEYSANYIESDALIQVYRDDSGRAFVHYLIEPSKFSIEEFQGLYRTILNVNGIVSNAAGKTVYQFDRSIPVEFGQDQFAKIKNRLFAFQDMFPLIDGNYKFSVLWKNTVSKEFTSVEATIKVPPAGALTMSSLLLANRVIRNQDFLGKVKPFTSGGVQLVASPRNDFAAKDTMSVFLQLGGLPEELARTGSLAFTIMKDDQVFQSFARRLGDYPDIARILEDIPLANFPPAYYTVKAAVLNANRAELVSDQARFYVSLSPDLPRPWILYAPLPAAADPYFSNVLGMQCLHAQDMAKAKTLLGEAFRAKPDSVEFGLDFCRVLFATKDYEGLKSVALPFYRDQKKNEFAQFLGETSQALGDYSQAIAYYKDYLASFGTNLNVLNAIGECYLKVGDTPQALAAWTKSLELNPKQDALKKKVDDLRGKIQEDR